jgi:hypothetical protein
MMLGDVIYITGLTVVFGIGVHHIFERLCKLGENIDMNIEENSNELASTSNTSSLDNVPFPQRYKYLDRFDCNGVKSVKIFSSSQEYENLKEWCKRNVSETESDYGVNVVSKYNPNVYIISVDTENIDVFSLREKLEKEIPFHDRVVLYFHPCNIRLKTGGMSFHVE